MCKNSRNDLWLGGKGELQMRKCLDCGYVGSAFVSVDDNTMPFRKL
jgi:hypothetical protein